MFKNLLKSDYKMLASRENEDKYIRFWYNVSDAQRRVNLATIALLMINILFSILNTFLIIQVVGNDTLSEIDKCILQGVMLVIGMIIAFKLIDKFKYDVYCELNTEQLETMKKLTSMEISKEQLIHDGITGMDSVIYKIKGVFMFVTYRGRVITNVSTSEFMKITQELESVWLRGCIKAFKPELDEESLEKYSLELYNKVLQKIGYHQAVVK